MRVTGWISLVLNIDWIQTIPKSNIDAYLTRLGDDKLAEVFEAMKYAFGFDN